ncbi:MAG: sigma-70 family RNA polymerase sigma factor [Nitrososphaera sp.]|nr:sigma-70 family RNA polymerase sigma factor [Nitrososphaera sp.]
MENTESQLVSHSFEVLPCVIKEEVVSVQPAVEEPAAEKQRGLKGPPAVTLWWSHNDRRGGCPCVLKRKLGYVITRLNDLAKWEKRFNEASEDEPSRSKLEKLQARISNKEQWLDYSVETLRGAVRFALARIESDTEDHAEMLRLRAEAGMPFKHATGRTNAKWHAELKYYRDVLEQYLLAKTAVSGTSRASPAMEEVWKLCSKAVATYQATSGREVDDAMQQAALGIMRAASKFNPAHGGLAKFTTYAGHWIRRMTQVRSTDDCKPGQIMIKGKVKTIGHIDVSSEDDERSDKYHPQTDSSDHTMQFDVNRALQALSEDDRDIAVRRLLNRETLQSISETTGIPLVKLRTKLEEITLELQGLLKGYGRD